VSGDLEALKLRAQYAREHPMMWGEHPWKAGEQTPGPSYVLMSPDELDTIIAALERAEWIEKAAQPLAERCWRPKRFDDRDNETVHWRRCGTCPPCVLAAALSATPGEEGEGSDDPLPALAAEVLDLYDDMDSGTWQATKFRQAMEDLRALLGRGPEVVVTTTGERRPRKHKPTDIADVHSPEEAH
jgi:hypothetical protein